MDALNLFESYIRAEKRYSEHTCQAYITDLRQFSIYLGKQYEIADPEKAEYLHLRSWLAHLSSEKRDARTLRRKISSLNAFYKFLKKRKSHKVNPATKLVQPKLKKRLPMAVRPQDLEELKQAPPNQDEPFFLNQILVRFLYELGLRRSELMELKVTDIDLQYRQVKVLGKGGKERIIPYGNELNGAISRYLEYRAGINCYDLQNFFLLKNGKKLYPKMIYLLVKRWLSDKTSLSRKSPHVLRHSFATHLADGGADINAIKSLLGHSNLAATQIYMHNSIEQLKSVYKKGHPKAE